MSSDEGGAFVLGLVVGLVGMLVVGLAILDGHKQSMQREAIKHGAAQYHPETGQFEWKAKVEDGSK